MSMRIGNDFNIRIRLARALHLIALTGLLLCFSLSTQAIDNPDAPDYVGDFLKRAQPYERNIQQTAHTTQQYVTAYAAYEKFLDNELNAAYRQLMAHLPEESQQALKKSQLAWLNYRDQEFEFINHNWTTEKFGSSMVISGGDYRAKLIKDRAMILLYYFMNYETKEQ
ncbi:DUF1311 domain-containing protein [Nitrosomonas sp. JL21]|uniref:lysozyme inhibitor LprI family protein n=1 Tax=Nitrosomonas sp. JL21 TaxID=153949 RepID=UPI0013712918|nr:lysozyme inhibitor LprI family protein [Nitrosomonas sp. JL21]MBL8498144.1 DUF1311 domain-containing protein [Nitrosomonas sp.]MCC7091982.1 DUF1311 domain-containing protein [Nitrosomonas sp.]MXS77274.1 DUF1311 domain-containing protein [Nitrosomonas sp. JL21]